MTRPDNPLRLLSTNLRSGFSLDSRIFAILAFQVLLVALTAFTKSLKDGNLAELPKRTEALHGQMDTHVGLSA
jgi:hypothetical protein